MTDSSEVVTPVKTGVQCFCIMLKSLDSGFHRNDDFLAFSAFDEVVILFRSEIIDVDFSALMVAHHQTGVSANRFCGTDDVPAGQYFPAAVELDL